MQYVALFVKVSEVFCAESGDLSKTASVLKKSARVLKKRPPFFSKQRPFFSVYLCKIVFRRPSVSRQPSVGL